MMSLPVILTEAPSFYDLGIWGCMSLIFVFGPRRQTRRLQLPKFLTSTSDFGIAPQRILIYFYVYLPAHWKSSV